MKQFLIDVDHKEILKKINDESKNEEGKQRKNSPTLWKLLEKHFGKQQHGRKLTDSLFLKKKTIELLKDFDESMLQSLQRLVVHLFHEPFHSLKEWYVCITKAAKKVWPNPEHEMSKLIKRYMRTPHAQQRIQQRFADAGVIERNRSQIFLLYDDVLPIVQSWMISDDYEDKILACIACIGCRKTALLDKSITFTETDTQDKQYWIKQHGVLKDRTGKKTVTKPICFGFNYTEIKTAIDFIRNSIVTEGMTRREIGAKYGKRLCLKVKEAFPAAAIINKQLGTHFLRGLYGNTSFHFYKDSVGVGSLTSWLSLILGHNASLNTAVSYQTINIQFSLPMNLEPNDKMLLMEMRETIAALRQRIDKLEIQTPELKGTKRIRTHEMNEVKKEEK